MTPQRRAAPALSSFYPPDVADAIERERQLNPQQPQFPPPSQRTQLTAQQPPHLAPPPPLSRTPGQPLPPPTSAALQSPAPTPQNRISPRSPPGRQTPQRTFTVNNWTKDLSPAASSDLSPAASGHLSPTSPDESPSGVRRGRQRRKLVLTEELPASQGPSTSTGKSQARVRQRRYLVTANPTTPPPRAAASPPTRGRAPSESKAQESPGSRQQSPSQRIK